MPTLSERVAPALLLAAGLLTLLPMLTGQGGASAPAPLLLHWQFMMGMLGLGLLAAAFVPTLRMTVVSGAVMSKLALLLLAAGVPGGDVVGQAALDAGALALLLAAGAMFWRAAWQQARWEGVRT